MKPLTLNLLLAVLWVLVTGMATGLSFVLGFAVGALVLALVGPLVGIRGYARHLVRLAGFGVYYLKELFVSNLRVTRDILRPRMRVRPAIVAVPLDHLNPSQVTLLANLITMTPGTLSVDVSDDRSTLYVHAMYTSDADALRREIKTGLEERVKEVLR
jgi:multicomponent Na+:H+ antiporter subunit E